MSSRPWMRFVLATGVAAVVLVLTAVFAKPTVFGFAWLDSSAEGQWIVYPHPVRTTSYPGRSLQATFERTIDLAEETDLVAALRCVGRCVFEVGGDRVDPGRLTLPGGTHRLTLPKDVLVGFIRAFGERAHHAVDLLLLHGLEEEDLLQHLLDLVALDEVRNGRRPPFPGREGGLAFAVHNPN